MRRAYWRKLWLPILVGTCVFIINLLLWKELNFQEQLQIKRNVELVTVGIGQDITAQITTRTHALKRMGERWEFRGGTPRIEWEDDATNYSRDYKGYQALEWVDNRGYIRWIVPVAGNEGIENKALLHEPYRQIAMKNARESGNPYMTPVVPLLQGGKGFLIYVPLFLKNNSAFGNTPNTSVQQRTLSNFDGFIVAVLRPQPLFDEIINHNLLQQYAIAIFDQNQEFYTNELYRRLDKLDQEFINKWSFHTEINLNGVKWRLRVVPTKTFLAKQRSPLPNLILAGGSIAATLIASVVAMTLSLRRYASQVEQANCELSREISERRKIEASLIKSTEQLEDLYNNAPCGYHSLDQDGKFVQINDTELKWLGYKREEVIGREVTDFFTSENRLDFETSFSELKRRGFQRDIELILIRADGTKMPVLVSATAVRDEAGNFIMSRSTLFDISKRKQAEDALLESEKRFRGAFTSASIGMALVSPEGRWLQVNEALCQMIGYSEAELLATTFQAITHPDDLDTDLNYVQQMLLGEISTYQMEKRYFHKLGHVVWILLSVSLVWDKTGKPLYFISQIQDINARKNAEIKLRNLSNALESAVEGIAQIDTRGCYIFVNNAYAQMLGYGQEEMIGMEWQTCVHPEDLEKVINAYQEMLANGRSEVEGRALRQDGSVFDQQIVMVKDFNPEKLNSHYCFAKDISDRREVERLKDEFVSVVSHELRTPLTSIRGSLGLVANGVLQKQPEKAQRMLEIAVSNSDRLIRLINDILDIERIESGKVMMNKQICDAALLMSQSHEVMQAMAEKAGVNIIVNPVSAKLWADPDRIIQILTNLLSNAIKFSPPSSTILLTAEIRNEQFANSHILFQVKDQGRGIPQDKLETIFGRFQQVDTSDSRKKGGTGLGLAICRSIIQHHDGQIWAESNVSQGSTFYVSLPLLSAPEPTILANDTNTPLVLVCDDDYSARTVVQTMLEQRGYRTITAASGLEGIEIATRNQPDVIFLNLMMPGMNGWEVLAALKQQPQTQNIPVIILSGFMPDARLATKHPEVDNWIVKPPDEDNLFEALERALSKNNENLKVLIVEDDTDLAQVLIAIFERYGIETYHARDGRQAIHLSQCLTPYMLVLDIGLPEVDGFAVVDWLRHHNRLHQVPIVVYSAKDLTTSDRERLNLGHTVFLTKARVTPEEFEQQAITLLNCIVSGNKEGRRNDK